MCCEENISDLVIILNNEIGIKQAVSHMSLTDGQGLIRGDYFFNKCSRNRYKCLSK